MRTKQCYCVFTHVKFPANQPHTHTPLSKGSPHTPIHACTHTLFIRTLNSLNIYVINQNIIYVCDSSVIFNFLIFFSWNKMSALLTEFTVLEAHTSIKGCRRDHELASRYLPNPSFFRSPIPRSDSFHCAENVTRLNWASC